MKRVHLSVVLSALVPVGILVGISTLGESSAQDAEQANPGAATVTTRVDLGIGTLELPSGFTERRTGTKDSRMGEIRRGDSKLVVVYDIGAMAGLHMHPEKAESCKWFKSLVLGDRLCHVGLEEKEGEESLTVSLVPREGAGSIKSPWTYPANFTANIEGQEDLVEVLSIVWSYHPKAENPAGEIGRAVALGVAALRNDTTHDLKASEFKLVSAENKLAEGSQVWWLTFKSQELIPARPGGIIGAGREVFVTVDLSTGTATIRGFGE